MASGDTGFSERMARPIAGAARLRNGTLKAMKRLTGHLPLARQARIVRSVLPRGAWYRAALCMARAQGALVARMGGNGPFTTNMMLDFWLRELSFGGAFPIPFRVTGGEVCRMPGPKMYTWTHLPLTEVPLRAGLEQGGETPAVVSDPGKIVGDGEFLVFGWKQPIQAIPADDQLLRRVASKLKEGRSVVFLADPYLGGPLSDLPLRLAARLRVPLVFQWAKLAADGVLEVTFRVAPHPMSESEADLQENLDFLREMNADVLGQLGWHQG